MTKVEEPNKPVPVRLGDLKPILQSMAHSEERSMHYIILKLLREKLGVKKNKVA